MTLSRRLVALTSVVALLTGCGGGGGGGSDSPPPTSVTPTPTPSPTPTACALSSRQNWAASVLNEWYLFPETLPTGLNPASYADVQSYIDALTANARAQGKDRFFTYVTSIAEENAFYASGSSAGFGFRLAYDAAAQRVFVAESFENTPALNAGIDRGAEILAIGTNTGNLRTISAIIAAEGTAGVSNALGPSTVGLSRVIRFRTAAGVEQTVTVAKAEYDIQPVSSRYGARIIDDGGRKVGYVNLRTFISSADSQLRSAFANFKANGVTEVIVDVRYNGGGLVSIAELFSRLLGGQRNSADVLSYTTFRATKASNNSTAYFSPQSQSISATKIAFIGTGSSASASELVMNAMIPYLGTNTALVGTNTYGKPVGQIAIDQASCDDRLRVVAFRTENRDRQGDYYNGLAPFFQRTCSAGDDFSKPLGDPAEASVKAALDFLAGRSCTAIAGGIGTASTAARTGTATRDLIQPERPDTIQREVPGSF